MASKHELAQILAGIAELLELTGDNPFKIRAYQAAAHTVDMLDADFTAWTEQAGWEHTPGIGKALSQKIREYVDSGRINFYEELKASVPPILFEMVKIPGVGPKKARLLFEKLGIQSIGELEYACRENRLASLPGFGEKTQQKVLQGIHFARRFQGRYLLSAAWPVAEKIAEYLRQQQGVVRAEVAGSIRRRQETVKDIDIVVAGEEQATVMNTIHNLPGIQAVSSQGPTKASVVLTNGMNMDIRVVTPAQYPYALHHFTGSKEHHMALRGLAKEKQLKINEYQIEKEDGGGIAVADEAEFYKVFGLPYIVPELREGSDELEMAAAGRLPVLLEPEDITGVLHNHTTYSDGSATLLEMAQACRQRGWSYLGVTDHSQSAVYAHGLKPEAIVAQRQEIDRLNARSDGFHILAGIESDILPDGSLDYPDEVLARFDFVIASVHSSFRQSEEEMTRRIVTAMKNPYVSILGHPTGRILLAREGYAVNLTEVIKEAAATATILEINASPYRLDLDWRWCRAAKEQGVMLAINPDAHATSELDYVKYGVAMARKGWLSAADVLNTRDGDEVRALLTRKRV